jgi:hypothetical protein
VLTIKFKCACGKHFQAKKEYAGKQAKCPSCGRMLKIPQQSAANAMNNESGLPENGQICPICKWPMEPQDHLINCPDCHTAYHAACWEENKGCGIYGCSQVPKIDKRASLEIPASYWGQENKSCPKCGNTILAAAVRCRNCGATFISQRPEDTCEYRQRKDLEKHLPQLRRGVITLFIFCVIPFTAPFAMLFGAFWYVSRRNDIKALPVLYSAISNIAIYVGIGQTAFIILALMVFAWSHG